MIQLGLPAMIDTICLLLTNNNTLPLERVEFMVEINDRCRRKDQHGVPLIFKTSKELTEYMQHNRVQVLHRGSAYFDKTNLQHERYDQFLLVEAPLIFDIDAHDFTRDCKCSPKEVCNECWQSHIVPAIDRVFTICRQYGFEKILAFFSGGRGVHIYVTDKYVWKLDRDQKLMIYNRIIADGVTKLDTAVLFEAGHLTKVPLLPHKRTGYMCIPLPDYASFDPETDAIHQLQINLKMIEEWGTIIKKTLL